MAPCIGMRTCRSGLGERLGGEPWILRRPRARRRGAAARPRRGTRRAAGRRAGDQRERPAARIRVSASGRGPPAPRAASTPPPSTCESPSGKADRRSGGRAPAADAPSAAALRNRPPTLSGLLHAFEHEQMRAGAEVEGVHGGHDRPLGQCHAPTVDVEADERVHVGLRQRRTVGRPGGALAVTAVMASAAAGESNSDRTRCRRCSSRRSTTSRAFGHEEAAPSEGVGVGDVDGSRRGARRRGGCAGSRGPPRLAHDGERRGGGGRATGARGREAQHAYAPSASDRSGRSI